MLMILLILKVSPGKNSITLLFSLVGAKTKMPINSGILETVMVTLGDKMEILWPKEVLMIWVLKKKI